MNQPLNPKTLPEELLLRHSETNEMLSEAELWNLELRFFKRLLHRQSVNAGSEYGDRVAENLFVQLAELGKKLEELLDALNAHGKAEKTMLDTSTAEDRDNYLREHKVCVSLTREFDKRLKEYKKSLFEFSEHYASN